MTVMVGTIALVGATALPAYAESVSTTGAAGRNAYFENGVDNLFARDTLDDGHCARWQERKPGGSWQYIGRSACSSTEEQVGIGRAAQYRICRTGIGNCSRAIQL